MAELISAFGMTEFDYRDEFFGRKLYNNTVFDWGEVAKEYLPHFVWYNNGPERKIGWCSYCGQPFWIDKDEKGHFDELDIYSDMIEFRDCKHGEYGVCPICNFPIKFINENKMKSYNSLTETKRLMFSDYIDFNHVIFYGCRVYNLPDKETEYQYFDIEPATCYELSPGEVKMYYYNGKEWVQRKQYGEPFNTYMGHGGDYEFTMLGHECVMDGTFLQYFQFHEFESVGLSRQYFYGEKYWFYMTFLCDCCKYPQLEFLMKNECYKIVHDLVYDRNFNRKMLNWKAKNYAEFFGIQKSDVKPFIECGLSLFLLNLYHENGKKIPLAKICAEYKNYSPAYLEKLVEIAQTYNVEIDKINSYFNKNMMPRDRHNSRIYDSTFQMWRDYIDACKDLNIDLMDKQFLFPKDLVQAHDERVAEVAAIQDELLVKKAKKSLKRRDAQYNFENDRFIIYVPHTTAELLAEGNMQSNCVAKNYTKKHFEDISTICFLRDKQAPDEAFYTIEICNRTLHQKYGYLNDRLDLVNSDERRERWAHYMSKPRKEADEFFNLWLKWVEKGSPRDVHGKPIIEEKTKVRKRA